MRLNLTATLVAVALTSFGAVATAPAASAVTPGCVTRGEYRHVHNGYTKARVHRIFDTNGDFLDGFAGGYTRITRSAICTRALTTSRWCTASASAIQQGSW
jgi:hypothetical protein